MDLIEKINLLLDLYDAIDAILICPDAYNHRIGRCVLRSNRDDVLVPKVAKDTIENLLKTSTEVLLQITYNIKGIIRQIVIKLK